MNDNIVIWLHDNQALIIDLINPLIKQKNKALKEYEIIFHPEIINQYETLYLSIIGIEACRCLGCSVEDYYETIQEERVFTYLTSIILEGENKND